MLLRFPGAMNSHNSANKIFFQAKTHCGESLRVKIILTSLETTQMSIYMHHLNKEWLIHITENYIAIHVKKQERKCIQFGKTYLRKFCIKSNIFAFFKFFLNESLNHTVKDCYLYMRERV